MEIKEAIEFLEERIKLIKKEYPSISDYKDALKTAINALEKQIPKKVARSETGKCTCPVCGKGLGWKFNAPVNYCPKCGQRLKGDEL